MKRYLPFVIVAAVALIALGGGAMLYRAKRQQLQLRPIPENNALLETADAESPHIRGNPNAPVTLEEFGDFQCPPCGSFATFTAQLLKEYDSRLRIVFRNFPLPAHERRTLPQVRECHFHNVRPGDRPRRARRDGHGALRVRLLVI